MAIQVFDFRVRIEASRVFDEEAPHGRALLEEAAERGALGLTLRAAQVLGELQQRHVPAEALA